MTKRSSDGLISADTYKSLGDVVFPAADFTLVNLPIDRPEAKEMFKNLYNTPVSKHILLVFCRHPREDKMIALSNLQESGEWKYLDTVHLWYERPSSSSNIGFLPVAEEAFIFYKGPVPNIKNTSWFGGSDQPNATNMWGLSPAEHEEKSYTYYRKFTWEIGLLLATMSHPMEVKKFIYAMDGDYDHVVKFCKEFKIAAQLYASKDSEIEKIDYSME